MKKHLSVLAASFILILVGLTGCGSSGGNSPDVSDPGGGYVPIFIGDDGPIDGVKSVTLGGALTFRVSYLGVQVSDFTCAAESALGVNIIDGSAGTIVCENGLGTYTAPFSFPSEGALIRIAVRFTGSLYYINIQLVEAPNVTDSCGEVISESEDWTAEFSCPEPTDGTFSYGEAYQFFTTNLQLSGEVAECLARQEKKLGGSVCLRFTTILSTSCCGYDPAIFESSEITCENVCTWGGYTLPDQAVECDALLDDCTYSAEEWSGKPSACEDLHSEALCNGLVENTEADCSWDGDMCISPSDEEETCDNDGMCDAEQGETMDNCGADCGCNDNDACEENRGETVFNCANDCGYHAEYDIFSAPADSGLVSYNTLVTTDTAVMDVSGKVQLVYKEYGGSPGGRPAITSGSWNGETWSDELQLALIEGEYGLYLDGPYLVPYGDKAVAIWVEGKYNDDTQNYEFSIRSRFYDFASGTWGDTVVIQNLTSGYLSWLYVRVSSGISGYLMIACSLDFHTYYSIYSDGAWSETSESLLYNVRGLASNASGDFAWIATGADQKEHIYYNGVDKGLSLLEPYTEHIRFFSNGDALLIDKRSATYLFNRSEDTLLALDNYSSDAYTAHLYSILDETDPADKKIHVFWTPSVACGSDEACTGYIYHRIYHATTGWDAATTVISGETYWSGYYPFTVAMDEGGNILLAWMDENVNDYYSINTSVYNAAARTWHATDQIIFGLHGGVSGTYPIALVNSAGKAMVLYGYGDAEGSIHIYYSTANGLLE